MDGKFLSKDTKEQIVKVLDELTNLGIFEIVEKPAYMLVLNQIDKYADRIVPDEYDELINDCAELALNGYYEQAAEKAGILIDDLVDFEKVNDEVERLVFVDGLKFIVRQIQLFIKRKQTE